MKTINVNLSLGFLELGTIIGTGRHFDIRARNLGLCLVGVGLWWSAWNTTFQWRVAAACVHVLLWLFQRYRRRTAWSRVCSTYNQSINQYRKWLHRYEANTFIHSFIHILLIEKVVRTQNKKLISRWDSERELFYDDILMDWAVDTTGLIITTVTCCGQEAQSVSDTCGGRSGTRSCWWMVDQICADPVWPASYFELYYSWLACETPTSSVHR